MFDLKVKFFLIVSVFVLGGVTAANAQVPSGSVIKANIPSSFVVGDKTFPAGRYTIARTPGDFESTLLVLRDENSDAIIFDTIPTATDEAANETGLIFENVGGVQYLSKIVVKGESTALELPKNKAEVRAIAKSTTNHSVTVVQNPGF